MNLVRKYPKEIQLFNSILIAVSIVVSILSIIGNIQKGSIGMIISDTLLLGALICALIYMIKGHGKATAGYFKGVIWLFLLGTVTSVITNILTASPDEGSSLIGTVVIALFGSSLIAAVAFVPNLGQKKSLAFSGINLVMRFMIFVIVIILLIRNPQAREKQGIVVIYRTLVLVTLSAVIYINTCCKYLDKENRNTN